MSAPASTISGPTILEAMSDPTLFGRWFAGATWGAWRAFLAGIFGLPMTEEELASFRACTGRWQPPEAPAREAWVVVGRRGGKSRIAALVAVFLACFRDYRAVLAPGEVGTIMIIASDRRQARSVFRYVVGLLEGIPMLRALVERRTREAIHLTTRVVIEVHTCSFRSTRGYSLIAVLAEEVAFWRTREESENPDLEIINGVRPGLATIPGSLLLALSSPYARKGVLWEMYARHYGREGDGVVVWRAPTRTMHVAISEDVVAAALEEDEASARAEWLAEFRRDIESFVSREVVEAAVMKDRRELPPTWQHRYGAFCDPAGGSGGDSMTLSIAHIGRDKGGREKAILDVVAEVRPPFSPEEAVEEFAVLLKSYRVRTVTGDRYAGDWPGERFRKHGIAYKPAEKTKSQIYAEVLPLLNSRAVELLDDKRLVAQLLALERRTAWGGRDSIDKPPGGHDDVINACAGSVVLAWGTRRGRRLRPELGGVTVELADPAGIRP